jgi:hypothetical protein
VLLALLAACKADPNTDVCGHYAKLMVDCREDKTDDAALVGDTALNFCLKGMSGKHEKMFGANYRAMIECTRTATTCAAYQACQAP